MNESAALSKGHDNKEREAELPASSSEGPKDGCKDKKERETSESATLTEGRDTQDDFFGAVEEADASDL